MIVFHGVMLAVGVVAQLSALPARAFLYGFVALTLAHFVATGRIAARTIVPADATDTTRTTRIDEENVGVRPIAESAGVTARQPSGVAGEARREDTREPAEAVPD